jgi:flagellar basal-body rod protein FlgB
MIKRTIFQHAHLDGLKQALAVYAQRHRVTADNVANVETPGYRAQEYRFEDLLRGAQHRLAGARTHAEHLPVGSRRADEVEGVVARQDTGYDNGINDVDIDREMTELATNDLSYRLATRLLSMKYRLLRESISGRIAG